jgi:hypothetical protein
MELHKRISSGGTLQIILKLRTALSLLGLTALLGFSISLPASAGPGKTDAPGLRSIAFEHYLSGDSEAALDYYQKAVDTAAREYGQASSYIGQLYYEMGTLALDAKKFVRSESYLQKAVQHSPNSVMARVKFAELLQLRGKNDEALAQIQAALAKHSSSPEAREALVTWLQANKKTARAIHESYNLSMAANGSSVPPPVLAMYTKQSEPTAVVAAVPAPTPAIAAPTTAAAVPGAPTKLKLFPWMMEKKPEPKQPEADTKKPAEKKEERKEQKKDEKKPAETKKKDKKANKKDARTPKSAKESKHAKAKDSKKVDQTQEELRATAAALRTTAKTLPKKKDTKSNDGSDPAESGEARSEEAAAPAEPKPRAKKEAQPKMVAAPPPMVIPGPKSMNRGHTMVPPPPPMVPDFRNPMGMFQPQPMRPQAQPKTAKKPAKSAPIKEAEPARATPSAGTGDEPDADFILDWAGAKSKKKAK